MAVRLLRFAALGAALPVVLALLTVFWLFGGGERFPDRTTLAQLAPEKLETVAELEEPPGNIAVSPTGRIFITIHPESKPPGNKLVEIVNGKAHPFPDLAQGGAPVLWRSPQGLRIDRQNRLWVIDHGDHGRETPSLTALDLDSQRVVHRFEFDSAIAPWGSYLQDLVIDPSDGMVFIADVSYLRRDPALIIYNPKTQRARRFLEGDDSVTPQNFKIFTATGPMDRLGGLVTMKVGVDSIGIDHRGEWLYYGAMNHGSLYRIKTSDVKQGLPEVDLRANRQLYAAKPLTDGITLDQNGAVYLTDIEHGAIALITPDRRLSTLIRSPKLRWPDGFSFGPGGYLYIADSDIPDLVMTSREQVRRSAPYFLFRIKLDVPAVPGH